MSSDERFAKLLALSVIYEKSDSERELQVRRVTCDPENVSLILDDIMDERFKDWIRSVVHLFKSR